MLAMLEKKARGTKSIEIEVYHKATSVTREPRAARRNAEIRIIQKKLYDRDPFFFTAEEETKILDALYNSVGGVDKDTRLFDACKAAGRQMVKDIRAHIDQGITKGGGKMPVIKKKWAIRKAWKHGTNKAILRDTDQLYDSLVWRVRVV